MTFDEWFEANKELTTQLAPQTMLKSCWGAAWQSAVEKHWDEAYELGKTEGKNEEQKKALKGLLSLKKV